uniref:Uncharacterized protein n=1 Tax=Knipowitschia caucasica TaxID=637954 RepID=A0AAV2J384_KNICA
MDVLPVHLLTAPCPSELPVSMSSRARLWERRAGERGSAGGDQRGSVPGSGFEKLQGEESVHGHAHTQAERGSGRCPTVHRESRQLDL